MASRAYYGCIFKSFASDLSVEDFMQFLAVKIVHNPKRWGLVKFVIKREEHKDFESSCSISFIVMFNAVIDDAEYTYFIQPFEDLKYTNVEGLEL